MNYKGVILSTLVLLAVSNFVFGQQDSKTFFIATNGIDSNSGTIDSPFASLERARNAISELKTKNAFPRNGVTVYVRKGIYQRDSTFQLKKEDSGLAKAQVKYSNYNQEEVRFIGGKILPSNQFKAVSDTSVLNRFDANVRDKIVKVDLKSLGIKDFGQIKQHGFSITFQTAPLELFIDGAPLQLAKWPNTGRAPIVKVIDPGANPYERDFSGRGATFTYDYDRASRWKDLSDVWLYGVFSLGFADANLQIANIDLNKKQITTKQPDMFTVGATDAKGIWGENIRGYYVYNVLEEIDSPGEYFVDKSSGILYLYPPKNLKNSEIIVSTLEKPMVLIDGVVNVKFSGINFEVARGMGFNLVNCQDVTVENCTIRNVGTLAAMFGQGVESPDYPIHEFTGKLKSGIIGNLKAHIYNNTQFNNNAGNNNGFKGCKIYNTGTGAIFLSGGDRTMLIPAGNYVTNCEFYDYNRWNRTYCPAVALVGVGNSITHCYIHDAPHQGISINGNEHLIEFNRIEKVCLDVVDNGSIYIGRNPSERGNVIRQNYFGNIGKPGFKSCAIHLDDGTSGTLIEKNIFYHASNADFGDILINGGCENTITNNIFIEGSFAVWMENQMLNSHDRVNKKGVAKDGLWGDRMLRQIDITSTVWKSKYPGLEKFFDGETPMLKNLIFSKNVLVRMPLIVSANKLTETAFSEYKDNFLTNTDPGFVDFGHKNFNLKSNATIYTQIKGFKNISFDQIGLLKK